MNAAPAPARRRWVRTTLAILVALVAAPILIALFVKSLSQGGR